MTEDLKPQSLSCTSASPRLVCPASALRNAEKVTLFVLYPLPLLPPIKAIWHVRYFFPYTFGPDHGKGKEGGTGVVEMCRNLKSGVPALRRRLFFVSTGLHQFGALGEQEEQEPRGNPWPTCGVREVSLRHKCIGINEDGE